MSETNKVLVAAAALATVFCALLWGAVAVGQLSLQQSSFAAVAATDLEIPTSQNCTGDDCLQLADLRAQQSVAVSTSQILFWTAVSALVGFVGMPILAYGLWLNSTATEHARKAAEASTASARAQVAQTRPWIKVGLSLTGPLQVTKDRVFVTFELIAQNVGQTPALHVEFLADMLDQESEDDLDHKAKLLSEALREAELSSGETVFPGDRYTERQMEAVAFKGTKVTIAPTLFGVVQYAIASGDEPRQTPFRFRLYRRVVEPPSDRKLPSFLHKARERVVLLEVSPGDTIPAKDLVAKAFDSGAPD